LISGRKIVETEQTDKVRRALSLRVDTRRSSFGLPRQVVGLKVDSAALMAFTV